MHRDVCKVCGGCQEGCVWRAVWPGTQAVMCVQSTRVGLCEPQVPAQSPAHVPEVCVQGTRKVCRGRTAHRGLCPVPACASGDGLLLTFEHGADPPDAEAALAGELPKRKLHEEEGDAAEHQHDEVGEHEGTWQAGTRR